MNDEKYKKLKTQCDSMHEQYMKLKEEYEILFSKWKATSAEVENERKRKVTYEVDPKKPKRKRDDIIKELRFQKFTKTDLKDILKRMGASGYSAENKEKLCIRLEDVYGSLTSREKDAFNKMCAAVYR
jgi:predicted nuclease with TOPRIM domain